tara:strand:+ start:496 stop:3243 length:2748 start_codon:yes stop_codon:yes gene_type:complete
MAMHLESSKQTVPPKENPEYMMAKGQSLSWNQAMKSPESEAYKKAADSEVSQLDALNVFQYITIDQMKALDPTARPIHLGWTLMTKKDAVGNEIKKKGRLYLRGDQCIPDVHYDANNSWSSTTHMDTVKMGMGMAAFHNCPTLSFDVSGAYVRTRPLLQVFVKLIEGYKKYDSQNREMVGLMTRSLYGNPESGAVWSVCLIETCQDLGWSRSLVEPNLYRISHTISGGDGSVYREHRSSTVDRETGLETYPESIQSSYYPNTTHQIKAARKSYDLIEKKMRNIKTRYDIREAKEKELMSSQSNAIQEARKRGEPDPVNHQQAYANMESSESKTNLSPQNKRNVYPNHELDDGSPMTISDDIQGRRTHVIPIGEEYPHIRPYDESTLCSNLPPHDTPDTLWAFALMYVDDSFVVTNCRAYGEIVCKAILKVHPGVLHHQPKTFLGLGMDWRDDRLIVTQKKLIDELRAAGDMSKCAGAITPLAELISRTDCPEPSTTRKKSNLAEEYPYRSVLGKLLYLCHSRPDLRLACSQLAKVADNPAEQHVKALKRAIRYVHSTRDLGLVFGLKNDPHDGKMYVCADACHGEQAISGMVGMIAGAAFTARAWGQKCVSLHSYGAEAVALADSVKLAIWAQGVLEDMGFHNPDPVVVYDDSQSVIKTLSTEICNSRTRHLRLRVQWSREMQKEGRVEFRYVNTLHNMADMFTKPLAKEPFRTLRDQVLGIEPPVCRREDTLLKTVEETKLQEESHETRGVQDSSTASTQVETDPDLPQDEMALYLGRSDTLPSNLQHLSLDDIWNDEIYINEELKEKERQENYDPDETEHGISEPLPSTESKFTIEGDFMFTCHEQLPDSDSEDSNQDTTSNQPNDTGASGIMLHEDGMEYCRQGEHSESYPSTPNTTGPAELTLKDFIVNYP